MKKIIYFILLVVCVFFSECRKEQKPDVFKITEVDVNASYTNAEIKGSYSFVDEPRDMKVIYGENKDLADAQSLEVDVVGSDFNINVTDLKHSTKYYYCFECSASQSSIRSEIHSFVTLKADCPSVVTKEVSNVSMKSASVAAEVISDGGLAVTKRGICWSTHSSPSVGDSISNVGSGVGYFTVQLINLTSNTTYYVRAYAVNELGTSYGEVLSFITPKEIMTPTVTTKDVTDIKYNTAISGGEVTSDGGATVTVRGVCFSTAPNPTINNLKTTDGSGEGAFTSQLYNLVPNTTYYVRAYAVNSKGTSYGEEKTFTTPDEVYKPTVETKEVTNVVQTAAVCGGEVTSDGGATVTARGVCFNTTPNPTINDYKTNNGSGTGSFTSNITGLTANTTYYIRAYATNEAGTSYGEEKSFVTNINMGLPEVVTNAVTDITPYSANGSGEVVSDGGTPVTERGLCWSTYQNPTVGSSEGLTTNGSGVGSFADVIECLEPNTTYYVRAYATNSIGTAYGEQRNFTSGEDILPTGSINGYDYVDLGLPSGLKWATCNVGANKPLDYGDYYAWGEITPKTSYTEENSLTYGVNIGNDISGNAQYDAATANWGNSWRMPTETEVEELYDECTWVWMTICGQNVYKVIGPNGNYIYLTMAGHWDGTNYDDKPTSIETLGRYWTATIAWNNTRATDMAIDSYVKTTGPYYIYAGRSIRPVSDEEGEVIPLPAVSSEEVTNITQTSVKFTGSVTDDGGAVVTARGACWSTSSNPTIYNNSVVYGSGTGSYTASVTGLSPNTTYHIRAFATNAGGTAYGDVLSFTTLSEDENDGQEPTDYVNGHGYVDLGLPSGLLWANCNLGAETSLAYGDYYAWAEIATKDEYKPENSIYYNKPMNDISGDPQYDAARANWGGNWRMPTQAEMEELQDICTWEWKTYYGMPGYKVTGTNGNHIFLSAAGYYYYSTLNHEKIGGIYWSSTPGSNMQTAYYISFEQNAFDVYGLNRYDGINIRPVIDGISTPEPTLPSVTTSEVSDITYNSATCGGEVTDDGGAEVTARGICWSTTQNPTISDNKTEDGSGIGSFTSNLSNLASQTTYYVRAYATNEKGTSYGEEKSFTTLEEESLNGTENGHEYVDLGLPSGLLWATCNVGANSPEEYGDYYAWGETTTKSSYDEDNCPTYGLSISELQSQGYIDGEGNLIPTHDAATTNWGGSWRMPTYDELNELINNCTWIWTTQNGINGYNVEGPNGNSIFLPAAGRRQDSSLIYAGYGSYWSSTPIDSNGRSAYLLNFHSGIQYMANYYRSLGLSVRPVFGDNFTGPEEQPEEPIILPTVTTTEVTNITVSSATCGGNVTSDGNGTVTSRGICWSTSPNPTIADNKTTDGSGTGSFTSNLNNLASQTTYYVRAYATNEKGTSYGEEKSFTTLEEESLNGTENGHEYVDIGLPSGLKWATCNVGANSPEEYGDYYAWGETTTKSSYDEDNCPTYGLSISELQSQGYIDGEGNLIPTHDAATTNWGGSWRMPTYDELNELINNCTWIWTTQNGINGYNVEGPNGNSIFLPAAGCRGGSSLYNAGNYGYYWSSTPVDIDIDYDAYGLYFYSVYHGVDYDGRNYGPSVRPVIGDNSTEPEEPEITLPSVTTSEVSDVTSSSATCGGNVTDDGGATVTDRGVCWSTSPNPTIDDNKTTDGSGTGSFTSNLSNLASQTTYYVRAYATNEKGTSYGEEKSFTTLEEESLNGTENGHEYVDIGLPSGLKWATCNVGATTPEEYGDYYAWGETSTKETYYYDNCATNELSYTELQSQGYIDSEGKLTPQYDAATANWGGTWRMPTYDELNELRTKCTWTWITQNGVNGYNVEGPNGNSIFLPAAGYRLASLLDLAGIHGHYWSSTPIDDYYDNYSAYDLYFNSVNHGMYGYYFRYSGQSVRPVFGGNFTGPEEQPEEPETPSANQSFTVNGVSFTMIAVEGGTFKMGAQSSASGGDNYDSDADSDESPVHSVTLSDYYIGETEVTQELWEAVMGSNPSHFSGYPQRPVEYVSWNDCQEFITKLNNLTGKNFRLPTEAEWEYAARGGNKSKGYKYSGSNTIGNVAWYNDNSGSKTHDVKTKQANELGIYDMSGNVWEWCQDWYGNYSSSSQTSPAGPSSGSIRVIHGGGWNANAGGCRVSSRNCDYPGNRYNLLGLRLVL